MLNILRNTIMAGVYVSLGAIAYLAIPDKIVGACFFTLGIFLVTNYNSMMVTRVVPMYFAKLDYKWVHIPLSIVGNAIGTIIIGVLISNTRLVNTLQEPLTKVVSVKLTDNLLSLFIMAIFCGILVAYSSLTSRKYKKGTIAQLFYTAIFIVAFVICGFDHIIANEFYFSLYSFIDGFEITMLLNLFVVLIGNITGGILIALIEKNNLEIIETRRHYDS